MNSSRRLASTGHVLITAASLLLLLAGCDESVGPSAPDDTASEMAASDDETPDVVTPTEPTEPADSLPELNPWLGATVEPVVAVPGSWVALAPSAPVTPTCGVTAGFYTPVPYGRGVLLGVLLGEEWAPYDPAVSTTVLACLPPAVSSPVDVRVPDQIAAGLAEVCIAGVGAPEGCGLLRVVRPEQIDAAGFGAVAAPGVVAPGDAFAVTPATPSSTVCSRFEMYVGVDGDLDLVGFPDRTGTIGLPVPGATTTVPSCDTGARVEAPGEPVELVAPEVPPGDYVICLAFRDERDSCAHLVIES